MARHRDVDQRGRRDVLRPTKLPAIEIKLTELFAQL